MKPTGISIALAFALACTQANAELKTDVTIASPWEVASYDPAVVGFAIQKLQIMENLVDADVNGVLRPGLATAWNVSEDGLTWDFTLREGVTFHDGTSFDKAAAVAALTRAWEQPGILQKTPIKAISAAGEKVRITLDTPFASLPAFLAHATTIIPSPTSLDADGKPVALIGTGAFKVSEFTPPQSIRMVRNDAYWGEKPKLEGATYLASSRAETRALLAESGDADIVFTLDPSGYSHLQHVDTIETKAVPIPRVVALKVNAGHPFFEDARARQALSLAIPRMVLPGRSHGSPKLRRPNFSRQHWADGMRKNCHLWKPIWNRPLRFWQSWAGARVMTVFLSATANVSQLCCEPSRTVPSCR